MPDGAMYIFAKIRSKKDLMESNLPIILCLKKDLAVAPGDGFGDYKNFIRISACQDDEETNG